MSCFLGIDVGTSSLKAMAIDERGNIAGLASSPYSILCRRNGYAEQEPAIWWEALKKAVTLVTAQLKGTGKRIAAIGFSGQMHGTVLLDREYQVIRPAIIHCDARPGEEVEEIRAILGSDIERILMNPIAPGIMLPTLLWLKKRETESLERAAYALLPKDYLRFRITGEIGTDYSDASATLAFDLRKGKWAEEILEKLKLPKEIFPPCKDSIQIAGSVTGEAARELGLEQGIPVVLGGGDQAMQSIGCGAVTEGEATVNIGSGGQVCVQTDRPEGNIALGLNTFQGYGWERWYVMGATTNSGSSLKWLNQLLGQTDYEAMNREVEQIRPGCDGLVFLPYLSGERCPRMNADISGVFWGLSFLTDKARMTRAVMEGVAFALYSCLEACEKAGTRIASMTALGGGSRSGPWLQMQADIFNRELRTTCHQEQAVFGAAVAAAVGTGHFDDVPSACREMIRYKDTVIEPDPKIHRLYEEYYGIYKEIYEKGKETLVAVTRLGRR